MSDHERMYDTVNAPTPERALGLYSRGYYATSFGEDHVHWLRGNYRYLFNVEAMNIPRSTRREVLNRRPFTVSINQDFEAVLNHCARSPERRWINRMLRDLFNSLHEQGCAHSVECRRNGKLVGGLFGFSIGRVFFGKSMFSLTPNASKVALTHLAARLWHGGFNTLDSQTQTSHLTTQFGQFGLRRNVYEQRLAQDIRMDAQFDGPGMDDEYAMASAYLAHLRENKKIANGAAPSLKL